MDKRKWVVVLEKTDGGERELFHVEAVGYEQAITWGKDALKRKLGDAAPNHIETEWFVVRVDSLFAT